MLEQVRSLHPAQHNRYMKFMECLCSLALARQLAKRLDEPQVRVPAVVLEPQRRGALELLAFFFGPAGAPEHGHICMDASKIHPLQLGPGGEVVAALRRETSAAAQAELPQLQLKLFTKRHYESSFTRLSAHVFPFAMHLVLGPPVNA